MKVDFSKLGKEFIQGVLAATGFGALTAGALLGKLDWSIYVPLVALMIAFFFKDRFQTPPTAVP